MTPAIGRTVHYLLTETDAQAINRRRTSGTNIAERIRERLWPVGAQAHIGNDVQAGDEFPMMMTRIWGSGSMVNGQVFLDGNDVFWAASVHEGNVNGAWHWPEKVA